MRAMHIPADDETLRRNLEHANLPALLPAIVQLTGDLDLLKRFSPPQPGMMGNVEGALPEDEQAEIRALAFDALRANKIRASLTILRKGSTPSVPSPMVS